MTWKPRGKGATIDETTTEGLVFILNVTVDNLIAKNERSAAFRVFALKFNLPSGDCRLPGCGAAFLKIPENKEFCCGEHKVEFNNKHCR
jgi:hypothetical protein